MSDHVEVQGVVQSSIRGVITVELPTGQTVKAKLCGKMKKFHINVLPGDNVLVKLSPYDLTHGIIARRL